MAKVMEVDMPHTKFQMVFGPDNQVDLHMLIEGEMRATSIDLSDAPFAKIMLAEPQVIHALRAWMLSANGPAWMDWTDVEAALTDASVDIGHLLATYPATNEA